jgi:hypothetical protein
MLSSQDKVRGKDDPTGGHAAARIDQYGRFPGKLGRISQGVRKFH